MPAPTLDSFAADLYEKLYPLAYDDAAQGYALAHLCAAIGTMFQTVEDYARDSFAGDPGWSILMDVDRAPPEALGWLGQLAGVRLRSGLDDASKRAAIQALGGMNRGTVESIIGAAQQYLTGTKHVYVDERSGGNAYQLSMATRTSETPDSAAVLSAILEQKPGGIVLTYATVPGQTYGELKATRTDYLAVKTAYATYNDVKFG